MRETNDGFRIAEEICGCAVRRDPRHQAIGEGVFPVATPDDVETFAPIAQSDAQLLLERDGCLAARADRRACMPLSIRARSGRGADPSRQRTSSPAFPCRGSASRIVATLDHQQGSVTS